MQTLLDGAAASLELAADRVDATAAVGHTAGHAAAFGRRREGEAQHAREVALGAALRRGAHHHLDADPPLGLLPRQRRHHGARAPAGRHALHAGPRHRHRDAAAASALREPRQRHGGAELLPGVERRGPDRRIPARVQPRRAGEPEDGGQVVRERGGLGVEGQAAELGGGDVWDDMVRPEEQAWEKGRREEEHHQVHGHRRQARGGRGCHRRHALASPL